MTAAVTTLATMYKFSSDPFLRPAAHWAGASFGHFAACNGALLESKRPKMQRRAVHSGVLALLP